MPLNFFANYQMIIINNLGVNCELHTRKQKMMFNCSVLLKFTLNYDTI